MPSRDLSVSPDHGIWLDGKLACARHLTDGSSVVQDMRCPSVEYYYIELEAHAVFLASGLYTESYVDNPCRGLFLNGRQPRLSYPALSARPRAREDGVRPHRRTA
jgi:hypothetical protein